MPGSDELKILGFEKKTACGDWSLEEGSRFLVSPRRDQLGVYEMCRAFVQEIVCLSLLMSKNLKLKKVNKSFVPEPKESRQVFRVFSDSNEYAYGHCERFLHIWIFHILISGYVWYFDLRPVQKCHAKVMHRKESDTF